MKKHIIITTITIAFELILSVSCTKQETPGKENGTDSDAVVFTATIDQEITKTVLVNGSSADKVKVSWETTDRISIKGAEYAVSSVHADPTKATFSGGGAIKEDGKYKAIYPSHLYKEGYFELPSIQTYAVGKFNAPMYAESENELLSFKNICGVLCLSLKGNPDEKVKYITVTAKEGVCGKFTMSDAATLSLSTSTTPVEYSRAVSLDCGEGVALSSEATNFYIYLPPNTYTAGMKIIITTTDYTVFEMTTKKVARIDRNNIYTFNNWDLDFHTKPALLSGEFTVGPDKTVRFSRGNMWYGQIAGETGNALHFETNQWEREPTSDGLYNFAHVSHFTWSDDVAVAIGDNNSGSYLFCDDNHRQTVDGQDECYILSKSEWCQLFEERTDAANKYGYATVNNVHGIILFPDLFSDPYAGFKAFKSSSVVHWDANEYSEVEWIALEAVGAVFLPTTGNRKGSNVSHISEGGLGFYWSSTVKDDKCSHNLLFGTDKVIPFFNEERPTACSIRLVADVTK